MNTNKVNLENAKFVISSKLAYSILAAFCTIIGAAFICGIKFEESNNAAEVATIIGEKSVLEIKNQGLQNFTDIERANSGATIERLRERMNNMHQMLEFDKEGQASIFSHGTILLNKKDAQSLIATGNYSSRGDFLFETLKDYGWKDEEELYLAQIWSMAYLDEIELLDDDEIANNPNPLWRAKTWLIKYDSLSTNVAGICLAGYCKIDDALNIASYIFTSEVVKSSSGVLLDHDRNKASTSKLKEPFLDFTLPFINTKIRDMKFSLAYITPKMILVSAEKKKVLGDNYADVTFLAVEQGDIAYFFLSAAYANTQVHPVMIESKRWIYSARVME
ncbi:MAG TPA: hypothetical protein PKC67_12955 [Kiritimatiellia bacterium]|nr:hypothetical protein [Kiritimatiellia bacterium]HMP35245.1 hypothetical protein [Kiritimatiellia bacterium]